MSRNMHWMHWCLCWRSMRKNVQGSKKGCVWFWLQEHRGILKWFNIFRIEMLIRHATDGNLYLYDMVNIKKKWAPRLSNSCTVTNPFLDYMIRWTVLNVNEKKHKKSQWKARFRYTDYSPCVRTCFLLLSFLSVAFATPALGRFQHIRFTKNAHVRYGERTSRLGRAR